MEEVDMALWTEDEDGERHIVSKCGLYCDTCPAFQHGLCQGCPRLELGECVVRDCAHLKEVGTCHDCELDSCYHFEAYTARRQLMRERTKHLIAKVGRPSSKAAGLGCGGGCGGGCGTAKGSGGCSGCSLSGGCSALKMLEALEQLEQVK